jgi:hypothetical protein
VKHITLSKMLKFKLIIIYVGFTTALWGEENSDSTRWEFFSLSMNQTENINLFRIILLPLNLGFGFNHKGGAK